MPVTGLGLGKWKFWSTTMGQRMNALPTDVRSDKNIVVVPTCFERFTWGFHSLLYSQPGLIVSENSLKANDSERLKKTGVWKSGVWNRKPCILSFGLTAVCGWVSDCTDLVPLKGDKQYDIRTFLQQKNLTIPFSAWVCVAVFSFFSSSSFYPFSYYSEKIFKA